MGGSSFTFKLKRGAERGLLIAEISDKPVSVRLLEASSQRVEFILNGEHLSYRRPLSVSGQTAKPTPSAAARDLVVAPMPGKVVGALVKSGEKVKAGDPLVILESMKMEIAVRSDRDGVVSQILVEDGASVKRGQGLVKFED